jgi:uncharacterized protein YigA (DUF484 family)
MTTSIPHPLTNPITEDDIANYLVNSPDFFERHAELLATIRLTSPHSHRTVSLQERQAEMLREKIKGLEHRIMDMIRNGNENTLLSDKLLRWARSLFLANDMLALPEEIVKEIQAQFSVPQVGIKVWDVAPEFENTEFAQGVSDDAKLFASSLSEPFCGVNAGFDKTTISAAGWRTCMARPQWPRHRADSVGLARFLHLAGSGGAWWPAIRCRMCVAQGRQAAAQSPGGG